MIAREPCREKVPWMIALAVGSLLFLLAYFWRHEIIAFVRHVKAAGAAPGEDVSFYRVIDHTADLGIEVFGRCSGRRPGPGRRGPFRPAGGAGRNTKCRIPDGSRRGTGSGGSLVNFLRECLYLYTGKGF
jgi:hypothetical protein